jgi:hypothetical protein
MFEFINHASIKTHYGGLTCITDPWYISNAFGSWVQSPSPNTIDVFDIVDSDEKVCVVISHGHDDHIDDWFISKHLSDKTFFCPEFSTPGLEKRLSKSLGVKTRAIGPGETFGEFRFNQFVNPDFTKHDAVITIETPDFLIIHANDNWHKWPKEILDGIKNKCLQYDEGSIFLLTQFGVADCFPVNYVGISKNEAFDILQSRFESYLVATEANMRLLGLRHMYYYANQSIFDYKAIDFNGLSMYEMAQEFLSKRCPDYIQLLPGMSVSKDHKIAFNPTKKIDLFNYCLTGLENFINKEFKSKIDPSEYIKVKFLTSNDVRSKNDVNYIASRETWNRILVGDLTLESIIIGGIGMIEKPNINISKHHMFVSKAAYIAQNMIKSKGLSFFREFAQEESK